MKRRMKNGVKVKVSKEYKKAAAAIRKTDAYKRARVISDFTERICRRLEELGINQSEFARRLGVKRAYVMNFLRGNVNLTFDTAVKISTALEMNFKGPSARVCRAARRGRGGRAAQGQAAASDRDGRSG